MSADGDRNGAYWGEEPTQELPRIRRAAPAGGGDAPAPVGRGTAAGPSPARPLPFTAAAPVPPAGAPPAPARRAAPPPPPAPHRAAPPRPPAGAATSQLGRIAPAVRERLRSGQAVLGTIRLGELTGRGLDRTAVVVNRQRIGKLEPDWDLWHRVRSLVLLITLVAIVALVVAAAFSILVVILGAAANHAISKTTN